MIGRRPFNWALIQPGARITGAQLEALVEWLTARRVPVPDGMTAARIEDVGDGNLHWFVEKPNNAHVGR